MTSIGRSKCQFHKAHGQKYKKWTSYWRSWHFSEQNETLVTIFQWKIATNNGTERKHTFMRIKTISLKVSLQWLEHNTHCSILSLFLYFYCVVLHRYISRKHIAPIISLFHQTIGRLRPRSFRGVAWARPPASPNRQPPHKPCSTELPRYHVRVWYIVTIS